MLFKQFDPLKNKVFRILDQDGKIVDKNREPKLDDNLLLYIYRQMNLGRIADIKAVQFQRQGRILTFAPNYGQEAAQIGPMAAINKTDWLVPAFREFSAMLYHGVSLEQAYLYWYGNEAGSRFDDGVNVLPINIIIGSQINHAAGLGYARKLQKKDEVVVTFIGDGGTSHGEFQAGMNFAAVLNSPMVAVIQNNHWAISTPRSKATRAETLAQKAIAWGIPGIQVDGNDVLAMYVATTEAVKRARAGEGPTLIEAITYRIGAHTTSDNPKIYRDDAEVAIWEARDPIKRLKVYITEKGLWDDEKEEKLHAELNEYVLETFKKVEATGIVPLDDVFNYTYKELTPALKEQLANYKEYLKQGGNN
jgi:pyruvate dehydrogenase E1 component alpha subunit